MLFALGTGIPIACLQPHPQALPNDSDTAVSAAIFASIHSSGFIRGLAIQGVTFSVQRCKLCASIEW